MLHGAKHFSLHSGAKTLEFREPWAPAPFSSKLTDLRPNRHPPVQQHLVGASCRGQFQPNLKDSFVELDAAEVDEVYTMGFGF